MQTYDHYGDIELLNHLTNVLRSESPMSAESLVPDVDDVNHRWNQLLSGIADRQVQQPRLHLVITRPHIFLLLYSSVPIAFFVASASQRPLYQLGAYTDFYRSIAATIASCMIIYACCLKKPCPCSPVVKPLGRHVQ